MATQLIGSLALNALLPIQARPAGQVAWGPVAVPAGYTRLIIQIDLQQVASLTAVFDAQTFIAFDGVAFSKIDGTGLDLAQSGYRLVNGILMRSDGTVPLPVPQVGFFEADPLGPGPVRVVGFGFPLFACDLTTRKVQGTLSCSEAVISGATFVAF